jgi:hypothetical protein
MGINKTGALVKFRSNMKILRYLAKQDVEQNLFKKKIEAVHDTIEPKHERVDWNTIDEVSEEHIKGSSMSLVNDNSSDVGEGANANLLELKSEDPSENSLHSENENSIAA